MPPEYDPNEVIKYPLVLVLPTEPGEQQVTSKWRADLATFLSGSLKMAVLQVDGQGSQGRGEDWRRRLRGELGRIDVQDQLEALRWVTTNMDWVSLAHVGVVGANYGGSLALSLVEAAEVSCGIATNPVVDWRQHDAPQSEQFLGLPNKSFSGYQGADLKGQLRSLRDGSVLLVQGLKDSIVAPEQGLSLAKDLATRQVLFQQQIYPGEDNSLEGVTPHYLATISTFLRQCLVPPSGALTPDPEE